MLFSWFNRENVNALLSQKSRQSLKFWTLLQNWTAIVCVVLKLWIDSLKLGTFLTDIRFRLWPAIRFGMAGLILCVAGSFFFDVH